MLLESSEREVHYASDRPALASISHNDSGVEEALRSLLVAVEARRVPRKENAGCGGESDEQICFQTLIEGRCYTITVAQVAGSETRPTVHLLSPREQEIAYLIMRGLTNKAIAAALKLRPCTVSTYVKRLFLKMNVNTRSQLVAKLLTGP